MSDDKKNIRVFEKVYQFNSWGDRDSKSGTGSNLGQTAEVRKQLPGFLKSLSIKTVLDIPCGDFFWMKEIQHEMSEVLDSYIGADLVEGIVNTNRANFSSSKFSFEKMNLTSSALPKVDLIFCRDCLVHLSYRDIFSAIMNIRRSGSTYLLTTSFNAVDRVNKNIPTGGWRPLNLQKYPLCFSEPEKVLIEKCTEDGGIYLDKTLMLFRIKDINIYKMWFYIHGTLALGLFRRRAKKLFK